MAKAKKHDIAKLRAVIQREMASGASFEKAADRAADELPAEYKRVRESDD